MMLACLHPSLGLVVVPPEEDRGEVEALLDQPCRERPSLQAICSSVYVCTHETVHDTIHVMMPMNYTSRASCALINVPFRPVRRNLAGSTGHIHRGFPPETWRAASFPIDMRISCVHDV